MEDYEYLKLLTLQTFPDGSKILIFRNDRKHIIYLRKNQPQCNSVINITVLPLIRIYILLVNKKCPQVMESP